MSAADKSRMRVLERGLIACLEIEVRIRAEMVELLKREAAKPARGAKP